MVNARSADSHSGGHPPIYDKSVLVMSLTKAYLGGFLLARELQYAIGAWFTTRRYDIADSNRGSTEG